MATMRILLAGIVLLISGNLFAAPDLTGGAATAGPGQEITVPVDFVADGSVVALQFDLTFAAGILTPQSVASGTALAGHSFDWQEIQPGTLRVVITTPTQTPLVSGSLADFRLLIAADAQLQTYPLVISNIVMVNGSATRVDATRVRDGSVAVMLTEIVPVPALGVLAMVVLILLMAGIVWIFIQRGLVGATFSVFLGLVLFSSTIARAAAVLPGDANNDGVVDASDIPVIVEQILERAIAPGDPDCNQDLVVDVLDTVCTTSQAPNSPPVLAGIADQATLVDQLFTFTAVATDPDVGDTLTFSLDTFPAGMSIDPLTGVISWTPDSSKIGNQAVTVRVADDNNASDTESFVLTVTTPPQQNSAPDLVPPGDRLVQADVPFQTPLFAVDPDAGDVLTFSLTGAPAGMSIDPQSGMLSWTPTAGDLGVNGVSALVTDLGGLTDAEAFNIEVTQPLPAPKTNAAPVLTVPADQSLVFDAPLNLLASATDADGDTLTFAFINAPSGMSMDPATGAITWTPAEPQIGAHDVAVRVADTAGAVDVGSFIVLVNDINKPPVAVDDLYTAQGTETLTIPAAGVLDNDSDPNGDPMTTQLVTNPANGSLTLNPDGSFEYVPISPTSNQFRPPATSKPRR